MSASQRDDLLLLMRKFDIAIAALQEIANTDYRGNRPLECVKAEKALRQISDMNRQDAS